MVIVVLISSMIVTLIAIGYLVLGRNRHGEMAGPPQKQFSPSTMTVDPDTLKPEPGRVVRVYFLKPSRYDDGGYVQHYCWGVQPNNTLTVLAALNDSFNKRHARRCNVYLEMIIWDEICDGAIGPETVQEIKDKARADGVELLIGHPGVQSNQYPRGRDLALQFVAQGLPTIMGGFHVSGYPPSREFLHSCGVSTAVGEAENFWHQIIAIF